VIAPIRTAMVLAAGLGTRLRPITDRTPKALVEVGGRPMIEYALRMLAHAGAEDVVVNLHHFGDAIRERFGSGEAVGVRLHYSTEDPILDTGGGIAHARAFLDRAAFAVVNCDALIDVDLAAAAAVHLERAALATLVVREDPEAERWGPVDVDAEGRVRRFLGQPPDVAEPLERRMFSGVHVLSPEIFEVMPASRIFSITRDVYRPAVVAGARLFTITHRGYWRDLGTPESVASASRDLAAGRFRPGYL
jgi:NDP-sugar pyrophosphorylase family protein